MIRRCYPSGPASGATKRGKVGSPKMVNSAEARGVKIEGQETSSMRKRKGTQTARDPTTLEGGSRETLLVRP